MLQYFYKESDEDAFRPIHALEEGCWIHATNATLMDISSISNFLSVDFHNLQDCLDKHEIPRVEKVDEYLFIFMRVPIDSEVGLYTATLSFIMAPSYFLTISPFPTPFIDTFMSQSHNISTRDHSLLFIRLMFRILQEYTSHIKRIRHQVHDHEKDMLNVESDDITGLTKKEDILNQYHAALVTIRKALTMTTNKRYTNLYEEEKELVDDLLNTVRQSEDTCISSLKSIRSLRDSYQIIFTNNLHRTMKLLTALTILFNIPTMIASIYGMNIVLPMEKNPLAFFYIAIIISVSLTISWIFFVRKRWL